jgi:23S rRNA (uracil1939-C5)-methyltransferase
VTDLLLEPEKPAHGGTVIARDGGKVVFVHYALPGEVVRARPAGRRGGAAFARAVEVVEASPDRVAARCPHFGECGGCQWQHAEYVRQLELKRQVVAEVWERAGLRLPPDTPIHGMDDPWRYRVRGEFEAAYRDGQLELGFHRMRSHAVLPVRTCPIHDERIERALIAFRDAGRELGVRGLANLHLTAEPQGPGLLWCVRYQRRSDEAQTPALVARVAELLPDLVLLDDSMSFDFWDLRFRVRSDTFIQTNYREMQVLYRVALDMLAARPDESILDLYAGIGTISLAIARDAASVTAVEENPAAVQLGRLAARINSLGNVRFLAGRTEDTLRQVRLGEHQAAVLDPPRAGCEPTAIAELLRLSPPRIVYVSCEPSTHARDIGLLVRGGYRVRRAALVDMFPHTYHVESVALLERPQL